MVRISELPIERAVLPPCRNDTGRNRNHARNHHGNKDALRADPEAVKDEREYRLRRGDRVSEIALQYVSEPDCELRR
jgi:hypothetical protein